MKTNIFNQINEELTYKVPCVSGPVSGTVAVPGSKSLTNRALLLAALAQGTTTLTGVLFSDDSRHFLSSLESLGFDVDINESDKIVSVVGLGGKIPNKKASIHVGSAGTAARFLTAMLALSNGQYTIECTEQMAKRPMKALFDALTDMGAEFEYLNKEYFLPVKVKGNGGLGGRVNMDIHKSTQFLSALLMVAPMTTEGIQIHITSEKKEGAYIDITKHMMKQFGVIVDFNGNDYTVSSNAIYLNKLFPVEPDMSAACYFYAIATLTGGTITVSGVHSNLIQGDIKFLDVLEQLGCSITETDSGIRVSGPKDGIYEGIDVDMNNFSDQTMTMAALAAFANSDTVIRNVSHIRLQESDRMQATVNELRKIGASADADGTNIFIKPAPTHGADIETYEDHRMAMAFSLFGLKTDGVVIHDPLCCKKTFENYFEVLDALLCVNK